MTALPLSNPGPIRRRRKHARGVALIMVLGAITILTVMLAELQDHSGAEMASAMSARDAIRSEYAAKSGLSLARLLIAAEPTIRTTVAPIFMLLMRQAPPQIPVWEFADMVLGAFNDKAANANFAQVASVNLAEGKNLGLDGAAFDITIVDEDSKLNLNVPARGSAFGQIRTSMLLLGLFSGPQYDLLFQRRDETGSAVTRQQVCSALVDWTDPDQDQFPCDPRSANNSQSGPEDGYYQTLKRPYKRKNAAFDSLEELHMVRGIGEDLWATFFDPDPDDPKKRVVTVWGQGGINVNSANAQTLLSTICAFIDTTKPNLLCVDPTQQQLFLTVVAMVKSMTSGLPLFPTPQAFVGIVTGANQTNMVGMMFKALNIQPVVLISNQDLQSAVTTESQVFSIYVVGRTKTGKQETRVRLHAVVDYRGSPPPGTPVLNAGWNAGAAQALGGNAPRPAPSASAGGQGTPPGAQNAYGGYFAPDPGGNVVYYRMD